MTTDKVMLISSFLDQAAYLDRATDGKFHSAAAKAMMQMIGCEALKETFRNHVSHAAIIESEHPGPTPRPEDLVGPLIVGQPGGPVHPRFSHKGNDDYKAALEAVKLAYQANCDWADEADLLLRKQVGLPY